MQFEFYVLNYDGNVNKVVNYNVFDNIRVQEATEDAVKRYLRNPKKFECHTTGKAASDLGFEGFCQTLRGIILWQEQGRYEYEISVGKPFTDDVSTLEKWDCYEQAVANIEIIAREVICQYKKQLKKEKAAKEA